MWLKWLLFVFSCQTHRQPAAATQILGFTIGSRDNQRFFFLYFFSPPVDMTALGLPQVVACDVGANY